MNDDAWMTCQWCATRFPPASACPGCGATAGSPAVVNNAGWTEKPPLPDMAKIQFGASRAQIEGTLVPVVDVSLGAGDGLYFTHDKLLWRDGTVRLSNLKTGGLFNRMRAGLPLVMLQAEGPGRIAFSDNHPGEIVPVPLDPRSGIKVREHHMLFATHAVAFDGKAAYTWYTTVTGSGNDKERETHYPLGMYVDHFTTADAPGLLVLHAVGNVFTRDLAANEPVDVSPHSVLAWQPQVRMHLRLEATASSVVPIWGSSSRYTRQHYLALRATGPGRIWIQSGTHGRTEEWRSIERFQNAELV